MDRLSQGYKRSIDKIWGPIAKMQCNAKNGFSGQKPSFWAPKKDSHLNGHHVLPKLQIAGMCDTFGDDDHGNIVGDEVEMMIERAEVVWRLLLCL